MDTGEIAGRLLPYLSARLGRRELAFSERLQPISGGFDTAVFGFALASAPDGFDGRLVLRLGREGSYPPRFALEAATQRTLAAMGYPVPRVPLVETSTTPLGGPFLIMERLAGRPLGHDLEALAGRSSAVRKLKTLLQLPATSTRITATWAGMQARLHRQPVGRLLEAVAAAGLDVRMLTFEGQLARLTNSVESGGLCALMPGVTWLNANRPDHRASASICHGDFHPLNIMADAGMVTGVIDWASVVIAAPEMDVGSTITNIATVPIGVPKLLRPPVRGLVATLLRRYVAAYRRTAPLNDASLRYYQVFRAMVQLWPAASALLGGNIGTGIFHSEAGIRNLVAHIRAQGGPLLRL